MKNPQPNGTIRQPELIDKAKEIDSYLKTLSAPQLAKAMLLSESLAIKTMNIIDDWSDNLPTASLAIDSFVGDIYSGLRASEMTDDERDLADKNLRILSGLYGVLRPYDGVHPYRLEMGYRLASDKFNDLYNYWGDSIANTLIQSGLVVNVSAVEYTKTVLPFIDMKRVFTPKFLTKGLRRGNCNYIVVHSKVARGAFARWIIQNNIEREEDLFNFNDLGYRYNKTLSAKDEPVFTCDKYGGLGLSIRLK